MVAIDTSFVRTVINAFHTRLLARPALSSVPIIRYIPDTAWADKNREYIVLAVRVPGSQDFITLGRTVRGDRFRLHGEVNTFLADAGDAAADTVWARAELLFAEIEQELTPPAPGVPRSDDFGLPKVTGKLTEYEHISSADDRGRWHTLRFQVEVTTRMTTH